uniref:CSON014673 protein n=1 Tax=Culicoides sonorensis TaxID=179676 RepID=A0A336KTH8_CULSO
MTNLSQKNERLIVSLLFTFYVSLPPDTDLWKFWTKRRYVLIIMCFFGFANAYSLRVNLSDVIGYELAKAGFTSSLPYLTMGILLAPTGYLADFLITRDILSVTNVRRFFNCGGFLAQTVFMMSAGYLTNPAAIITCLVFGVGLGAFSISGFAVNALDLAPNHAAVIMGITNTFATLPGIISPMLTGFIVTADPLNPLEQDKLDSQWKIVFIISASIYLVGCVVYWFFCSGNLQPWAIEKKTDGDHVEEKSNKKTGDIGGYDNKSMEYEDGE